MLALRKTETAFGAALASVEAPGSPPEGCVLLEVAAAGICGSDLHAYEWTPGYEFMAERLPVTLGHEFSGVVREIGSGVASPAPGDRVICWPTIGCGDCRACEADRPQDCQARRILGLHADGGFAERTIVPAANCYRIPQGLSLEAAALAEPLAVAVHAVDTAEIAPGDAVAVLGPGPIGIAAAWVARRRGAEPVLLAGLNDSARLRIAREIGLRCAVDLAEESLERAVARLVGRPMDRVIEATGAARSISEGLSVLRSSGVMVVAGIHAEDVRLDLTRFVRNKQQLRAAHDTTDRALREALDLLAEHGEALSRLISHRLPLERAVEGFELARGKQAAKVLLLPQAAPAEKGEAA